MRSEKQTSKNVYPIYYYKYAAVWLAAAAALIIVIFLPIYEVPVDPNDPFPEDPNDPFSEDLNDQTNFEKNYFIENYQSEITFEFKGI